MKSSSEFPEILVTWQKVDFRKWIDGLNAVVQYELKRRSSEKVLFVFISKCRRKVKALYWDQTGFAVWYKRLESGKFRVPKKGEKTMIVTHREFELFLEGYDILKLTPNKKLSEARTC